MRVSVEKEDITIIINTINHIYLTYKIPLFYNSGVFIYCQKHTYYARI